MVGNRNEFEQDLHKTKCLFNYRTKHNEDGFNCGVFYNTTATATAAANANAATTTTTTTISVNTLSLWNHDTSVKSSADDNR